MTLAPKPGDAMTQSELLTYLFAAPQSGDWLRYRVSLDGSTILTKTIGFGAERFGSDNAAFFEIQTQSSGLIAAPVESRTAAGGSLVWKMYVDAANFNDGTRLYAFVAGVIKIGDALFRLGTAPAHRLQPAYHEPLQTLLLYGTLPLPDDRSGVVQASEPEDVTIGPSSVHCVHTTIDFPARDLAAGAGLAAARVEAWQTPDVPLGLVAIRTIMNGRVYSVELTAFGRGTYRSAIDEPFESIPMFPG